MSIAIKAKISKCKLCCASRQLIVSHVIPDFFIRSLERRTPTGKSGQSQPSSILMSLRPEEPGGARQRGYWEKRSGLKEPLLCTDCEARFSRYENYFRKLFYGNKPGPLKKVPVGTQIDLSAFPGLDPDILGVSEIKLDYASFKLFVLSLLWRASVAKGPFFERVDLGPHENQIAMMLKTEDPDSDLRYPIMMVNVRHAKYGLEDFIQQPDCVRDGARRAYSFILGGFMLVVFVGADGHQPPDPVINFRLRSNGHLLVVWSRADHIFRWWAKGLKRAGRI